MRLQLLFVFLITSHFLVKACGYSFVGGCSTDVNLTINGTEATFAVASCAYEVGFDGLQLGTLRSLHLSRARAITWESCINNVSAVQLRYRVYEFGQTPTAFSTLDLPEDHNTLEGPYTTRYRELGTDINLCNGLIVSKKYVLEVYYAAEVDTIGDDFIPETTLLQNNNGSNYKLTFTYGGPSANPLLAVATVDEDVQCHGDSTGTAGVKVFGSTTGALFYSWSAFTQNFFTLFELPAGTYTVTVTETTSGNTATANVQITEPPALTAQFAQVTPVGCDGSSGGATAVITGGTGPYQLLWSSNDTSTQITASSSGIWTLSVTDAIGCTAVADLEIGGASPVQMTANRSICAGTTLSWGGLTFSESGTYNIALPGGEIACDTLVTLNLTVLEPALALVDLPSTITLTCAQPNEELCADPLPNTTLVWEKNGLVVSNALCYNVLQPGIVTVSATQQFCSASWDVAVLAQSEVPSVQQVQEHSECNGHVQVACLIAGGQQPYTFTWSDPNLTGNPVTASPGFYWVTVTDQGGCYSSFAVLVEDFLVTASVTNASSGTASDGAIALLPQGAVNEPVTAQWSTGATGLLLTDLAPGIYCATVTDAGGCVRDTCLEVTFTSGSSLISAQPFGVEQGLLFWPNPTGSGGLLLTKPTQSEALWQLFSATGQLIDQQKIRAGAEQIKLPDSAPSGWYRVALRGENFVRTGKIFLTTGR